MRVLVVLEHPLLLAVLEVLVLRQDRPQLARLLLAVLEARQLLGALAVQLFLAVLAVLEVLEHLPL